MTITKQEAFDKIVPSEWEVELEKFAKLNPPLEFNWIGENK